MTNGHRGQKGKEETTLPNKFQSEPPPDAPPQAAARGLHVPPLKPHVRARGEGFGHRILQTSSSRRRAFMGGYVRVAAHV